MASANILICTPKSGDYFFWNKRYSLPATIGLERKKEIIFKSPEKEEWGETETEKHVVYIKYLMEQQAKSPWNIRKQLGVQKFNN